MKRTFPTTRHRLMLAGIALAACAGLTPARAQLQAPPDPYLEHYLEQAAVTADENRYLVKADEAQAPAPNMEPRMVHPGQIDEAVAKLRQGGYCVQALCPTCREEPGCRRPNVLLFLVDDMGWGDFGPYGGGVAVGAATPNVNRLAEEGMLLTSTYAQPTCSPTRATIMTGQLPIHHGVLSPPMYGDPGGITIASFPLPHVLDQQGYVTRGVGKWHLGNGTDNLPSNVGFDEYYGFLNVSDMYSEWRDPYFNPEVRHDAERTAWMQESQFNHYLVLDSADHPEGESGCVNLAEIVLPEEAGLAPEEPRETLGNGEPCEMPAGGPGRVSISQLDQLWADYSVKFLEQMGAKPRNERPPWFLYHATRGCHFDNYPRQDFERKSYARTSYADCQVEMDEILGRLMTTLEATGQDRDTLVFFTSDNGPEEEIEPHGHTPFRGGKGDTWEGGMRVPGIARWKGMIEAGRRSDGLFDLADLYTTTLTLAGFDYAQASQGAPLSKRYLYGIDQTSFLLADRGQSNRRSELYWYTTNFAAVRLDEFKAHRVLSEPVGLREGNVGGLSGVTLETSYLWLFNLQADPQESKNVFIRHLWNQHAFTTEFHRFLCVLTQYPPHLPTKPGMMLSIASDIQQLLDHPVVYGRRICPQYADSGDGDH